MRNAVVVAGLVLFGVVGTAPAKTKKPASVSKLFCHAQYVYVQTYEGDPDSQTAREYPDDYNAAVGVQQRLQKWGRYKLVYEQQQADLVWVVWKQRKGGNRWPGQPSQAPPVIMLPGPGNGPGQNPGGVGPNPGGPGQNPGGPGGTRQNPGGISPDGGGVSNGGPGVGMVWPVNDQLAVYMPQSDESFEGAIWKKSEKDGLSEPDMPLFGKIADAVDDGCSDSTGGTK